MWGYAPGWGCGAQTRVASYGSKLDSFCRCQILGEDRSFRLRANAPEGQKRFPISKSPRPRSLDWVNFVGRITLWTVSGSLLFLTLAGVSSTLWLLAPFTETDWFLALHRFFLSGAVACTGGALVILFLHPPVSGSPAGDGLSLPRRRARPRRPDCVQR